MDIRTLLAGTLIFLTMYGCRKSAVVSEKTAAENEIKTVAEADSLDGFRCVFPVLAEFPGGTANWNQFLNKNLVYPAEALDMHLGGVVRVKFMIDIDGTICDIEAISGPEELKKSAEEVIRKSPNWIPGYMNNRKIKDYKIQPVIYRLD